MSNPQQISNYVPGITLAAALTSGAGPIVATLNSVAGLPIVGNFMLRLDDPAPATTYEWVEVTSVNVGASQVTIGTRGLEGTSPLAHGIGTIVSNILSAGMILRAFPWGTLPGGYAQITANQAAITAEVDVTGLTVTVTVGANRRIRISACANIAATVADDVAELRIKEGVTVLSFWDGVVRVVGGGQTMAPQVTLTPTAGVHTYKIAATLAIGTGSITVQAGATFPAFILVEDIGPA
jgi:hypothetical protein